MNQEKWREISKIFHLALEISATERRAFLDKKCADDPELRREIEKLLNATETEDSFIDSPKIGLAAIEKQPKLKDGETIGSFKVIRMLGAGGMGEVYLAKDLRLNRLVALKILPLNSEIDGVANRRFLPEARSSAPLEHPHICTTHEIGDQNGFSYIVMQYVEGFPDPDRRDFADQIRFADKDPKARHQRPLRRNFSLQHGRETAFQTPARTKENRPLRRRTDSAR